MDSPRVRGTGDGVSIPELGLQECATGVVEAASWGSGGALATEARAAATSLQVGSCASNEVHRRQGEHTLRRIGLEHGDN